MYFPGLAQLVRSLLESNGAGYWRSLLVLTGTPDWTYPATQLALSAANLESAPWIGDQAPAGNTALPLDQAGTLLGQEFNALVVDFTGRIDPDVLGAVSGTLRGGGLLILLLDPGGPTGVNSPRFQGRFMRQLHATPGTAFYNREGVRGFKALPAHIQKSSRHSGAAPCRTADQAQAVAAIEHLVSGHRRRPLVLVADRGRGKSAALGIASARLLLQGSERILLTGPRLDAVMPALDHASRLLPDAERGRGHLRLGGRSLEFVPPDALVLSPRRADLLLVDEAASIPPALLESLLRHYARIGFSTTVHGYEGTGRGFSVRFRQTLERLTPQWRELRLDEPIRWAPDDPLERTLFRALLLNAVPAGDADCTGISLAEWQFEVLDRDDLARDEALLTQVFGLLVLAHYRTHPRDLLHLLDASGLSVCVLRARDRVAATALAADEGGIDRETAYQISLGRRRLHGHLLPQTLAQHLGLEAAATLQMRRVIRIAVHPALQGQGLGTRLLRDIMEQARTGGLDACGACFGADALLLRFWQRAGFQPVRFGVSRETSSGSHSVTVLAALSSAGHNLRETAEQRFLRHFPHMLGDALRELDPFLAVDLMAATPELPVPPFDRQDLLDLVGFGHGLRRYEVGPAPLRNLAEFALTRPEITGMLNREQCALLLARVLQNRPWKQCADLVGLSGRKAAESKMRELTASLIRHLGNSELSEMVDRAGR